MKYLIEFEEFPKQITIQKALEWILYKKMPYNYYLLKKDKKLNVLSDDRKYNPSKTDLELAFLELYKHIKRKNISLYGIKEKAIIKDKNKWKDINSWDFSSVATWSNNSDIKNLSKLFDGTFILKWKKYIRSWSDIKKYKDWSYFEYDYSGWLDDRIEANYKIENKIIESDFFFWREGFLFTQEGMYSNINILFEELIKLYPENERDFKISIDVIDGVSIFNDKEGVLNKAGRKSFNWDEFHSQVGYIISKEGIPKYQKTLVVEMKQWAESKWGFAPSESIIKEKLKFYYDLIKPKNKDKS